MDDGHQDEYSAPRSTPGEDGSAAADKRDEAGTDQPGKDSANQPTDAKPATVGAALRAARVARKLTLTDISKTTKIRPGLLTSIENNAHDELPALTYTLGFIKAYARTVGLDPKEIANRYRLESHKIDPEPTLIETTPLDAKRVPSRRAAFLTSLAVVLVLGVAWAWGAGWFQPSEPKPTPAETTRAAPPAKPTPAAPATPQPSASSPVTLEAVDEVWLQVADGKDRLFSGTLKKGDKLEIPPGRDWKLSTGRAGAVRLQVGDKVLPPLGGPVEHVRGKLLTAAALLGLPAPEAAQPTGTPAAGGTATADEGAAPARTGLAPTRIIEGANPALPAAS